MERVLGECLCGDFVTCTDGGVRGDGLREDDSLPLIVSVTDGLDSALHKNTTKNSKSHKFKSHKKLTIIIAYKFCIICFEANRPYPYANHVEHSVPILILSQCQSAMLWQAWQHTYYQDHIAIDRKIEN